MPLCTLYSTMSNIYMSIYSSCTAVLLCRNVKLLCSSLCTMTPWSM